MFLRVLCMPRVSGSTKGLSAERANSSLALSSIRHWCFTTSSFPHHYTFQMMEVPALHQGLGALRISSGFNRRSEAVAASTALLSAACQEVQQCEVLRTVLKVALLAGE